MYKFLFIGILITSKLFAQTTLSLNDCIDLAIKNNFKIKQSEVQVESVINQYNQTKSSQLPTVSGLINQGYNVGRTIDPYSNDVVTNQMGTNNIGIRANWVVYNGFQNKKLLEQTLLQLKSNKYDVEIAKNEIKLNIIFAYMDVSSAIELSEVAQSQLLVSKLQVEKIEKLVRLNVLPESNLYDIKAQQASDEFQVTNSINNVRSSNLRLKQLLNLPQGTFVRFERIQLDELIGTSIIQAQVFDLAKKNFPDLKANQIKMAYQDKSIEIINSLKKPTVSLFGGWGTSYSSVAKKPIVGESLTESFTNQYISFGDKKIPVMQIQPEVSVEKISLKNQFMNNNNLSLGLNISIPIFNVTQSKYKLQNVQIQKSLLKNEEESIKTRLYQTIEQAFIDKDNADERYKSLQKQLIALEKALNVAEIKLSTGIINPLDYSITKSNFDKAKANLVVAKHEYYFRLKIIEFYKNI
jgi:outer membrane protein